MPKGKETL
jgi:hypothetical protein